MSMKNQPKNLSKSQLKTQNSLQTQMQNKKHPKEVPEDEIYQIYDSIFKRIFNLSSLAIINLVNALFHTNHSHDSKITYLNKEFVSKKLSKRFADIFLQINEITYHLEAQMTKNKNIVLRVFEYGFYHAMENQENSSDVLKFPEPIVIYLDEEKNIPKNSTLTIDFGQQGIFEYKVENFVYQEHELRELNQKKMIILIPFQLLKLRKIIRENPTQKNFKALQELVLNDIIGSIKANIAVGNITEEDADELKELTLKLYQNIYQYYEVLGGSDEMKQLIEGAMELPGDKYRNEIAELKEKNAKAEADKEKAEAEIQRLKKELEEVKRI